MNTVSYKVALGGVISSLCLLAMFFTSVAPFLYLTLPMIAGALITIIVVEVNTSWAFMTYISVSLLSIFVTFDKQAALIFVLFFGHYPVIKHKLERIKIKPVQILAKLLVFNICIVLDFELTIHLLGISGFMDDFSVLGKYSIYILWVGANLFFFVYDFVLTGCVELYTEKLKPKIFGRSAKQKKSNSS